MKVFAICILNKTSESTCTQLCSAMDLSNFGFFQRGSVGEFITFFARTIVERTPSGTRQSIKEQG